MWGKMTNSDRLKNALEVLGTVNLSTQMTERIERSASF
jgi:hypothetical protein